MKLSPRDLPGFIARPDPACPGILLYGPDPMRVALRRRDLVSALIGPQGEAEMRLTRLSAADLRRDPAALGDAMRASGFFPGQRAVLVEDAGDAMAATAAPALADWQSGDAVLILTAGALGARSTLRKLFETDRRARAAGIYPDPPSRAEVAAMGRRAGLAALSPETEAALAALAQETGPGDLEQTLVKLALYKLGDAAPATPADLAAVAPPAGEAALDDALDLVAEAQSEALAPVLRRLAAQGLGPVAIVIGATRHFRRLHAAACDPQGAEAGLARLRPPVFGPRRARMARQAGRWGTRRLEEALHLLVETDLALRSSRPPPAGPLVERALIRLAWMATGRN